MGGDEGAEEAARAVRSEDGVLARMDETAGEASRSAARSWLWRVSGSGRQKAQKAGGPLENWPRKLAAGHLILIFLYLNPVDSRNDKMNRNFGSRELALADNEAGARLPLLVIPALGRNSGTTSRQIVNQSFLGLQTRSDS